MPKRNRSRKMRGGLFGLFENNGSTTNTQGSGWFDDLKKKASSATGSATSWFAPSTPSPVASSSYTPTTASSSYTPVPVASSSYTAPNTPAYGGRKRKSRKMRGGYSDNVSLTNLASRAAPFSGETARAQAYVGGKRTKRRRHKKSHRRHHRK